MEWERRRGAAKMVGWGEDITAVGEAIMTGVAVVKSLDGWAELVGMCGGLCVGVGVDGCCEVYVWGGTS
jgi:hypothetical protein